MTIEVGGGGGRGGKRAFVSGMRVGEEGGFQANILSNIVKSTDYPISQ